MFLEAQDFDQAFENLWDVVEGALAIGVWVYAIYGLFTGKFSRILPIRASIFSLGRSSWPMTQAVVTQARLVVHAPGFFQLKMLPNKLFVWYEFEVGGVKYNDVFTAASPGGGPWAQRVASEATGEKLMIRYNPRNPSDAQPAEQTWHDLKVWWIGKLND